MMILVPPLPVLRRRQMEKGESRPKADDNNNTTNNNSAVMSDHKSYTASASSDADIEAAESMINHHHDNSNNIKRSGWQDRQRHKSRFSSGSAAEKAHEVEMTAFTAAEEDDPRHEQGRSSASERTANGGVRTTAAGASGGSGGGAPRESRKVAGRRGRSGGGGGLASGGGFRGQGSGSAAAKAAAGGGYEEDETVGLIAEEASSSTGSPSPARSSTGCDPAGPPLRSKSTPQRSRGRNSSTVSPLASSKGNNHRDGGRYSHRRGELGEGGGGSTSSRGGKFDEDHRRFRRRSSSSAGGEDMLLANSNESGFGGRGGVAGSAGDHGAREEFEWKSKALWYVGAFLLVAGSLVNFASFGFAPQSLLASLGSVQFISNVVFGKVILREVVTRRIIVGTATIILGNTLTLCFSPHQVCLLWVYVCVRVACGMLAYWYVLGWTAVLDQPAVKISHGVAEI